MPGLRRIVRTVGADLGKDVAFRVLHETGKLDRDNYNRCQVILEHMVRNALDHGIEDAGSRRAAGKSETGLITVDVGKDGGDYLIRLADDGRGMDPAVIRETAYRKGLDLDLESMSDDEVLRLIFHNGFSTAASVSEVSGRGVGMEIVLSELQAIGGSIDIESTIGEGSTFTIRIPSNVTANGALLVSAGEHSYAIPLDGLVAVEHVPAEAFFGAIGSNEPLELFSLQCEPAYLATLCHGEKMPDRKSWTSTIPVIVAGDGDHYMAIAIDDVEQALELVIRTLGSQFGKVPGLAGGATTADGRAIVALDLNALVGSLAARGANRVAMAEEQQDDMLVMVVDDSRTQRLVATSKFDSLGVETVTAENGMAAIDLLNASHRLPDVILLDVEMPVKDGIQTLKELRKSPRYVDIPVIMVTSRTGAKHRKMAAEAGCDGYMGKPFNFPLLVQDINKLTGRQLSLA
jgi:chemosensory pili system protein ChpA (sensor histidine kinase/response regulator)